MKYERTYREPIKELIEPDPSTHYILVLDHSGSMGGHGGLLEQLLDCTDEFFKMFNKKTKDFRFFEF